MSETETVAVDITLLDLQPVSGRNGNVLATAKVEVAIAGVQMRINGVEVYRNKAGTVATQWPQHRTASGQLVHALSLPAEISKAVRDVVLDAWRKSQ